MTAKSIMVAKSNRAAKSNMVTIVQKDAILKFLTQKFSVQRYKISMFKFFLSFLKNFGPKKYWVQRHFGSKIN